MSFESQLRDLETLEAERARLAWARASGEATGELEPGLRDRLPDLTADAAVGELLRDAREAPDGDARWWRLAAAERELLAYRSREVTEESSLRAGSGQTAAEVRLARATDAKQRDRLAAELRETCALHTEGVAEQAEARRRAWPAFLVEVDSWSHARGRTPARARELATELLVRTDGEFGDVCGRLRGAEDVRRGDTGAWADLPRFLAGEVAAGTAPVPDAGLLRFVLASLELERAVRGRLRLVHGRSPALAPAAGVHVLDPGRRVIVAWTDMGRMRDYRGLLGHFGRALPWVLMEGRRGGAVRYADPAIAHLFGALFEDLVLCRAWLEAALQGSMPATWMDTARLHGWLRLRQLAAQVLQEWEAPEAYLPARVSAASLERATGFTHPDGISPWSDAPSAAADELVGRLAAVALGDALAARHGRRWTVAAAGRLLREVWAAGPHGRLDALLGELGVGRISVEPLLELRLPILA